MKKTPWFDGGIRPARMGVYERKHGDGVMYSYWDGGRWCYSMYTAAGTLQYRHLMSKQQELPWRGLAKEPK